MTNDYSDVDALELLRRMKTELFDDSNAEVGFVMGRPVGEIDAWFTGEEEIDEDAAMKIRGIAKERLGGE